jgi:hypothetical protein
VGRQIKWSEFYDPKVLGALQEIFDVAWQKINSTPGHSLGGDNAEQRRIDLAQMIILAHKSGLQPEEIKASILGQAPYSTPQPGDSSI